ncbi:hypothetical protein ACH5RR_033978 [Cinchona calisaya]|uniref:RING-type E3 ubiquitin transferase n=1 Tax=Cinchona calisaya TaxID=153742 RepID=A0ABD2YE52_9GENT
MSSSPSGERTNNGNTNYQLYWCYQCHRTVRVASGNPSEIICPRCFGQFLLEIDMERPRPVLDFTEFDASPEARLLEALSLMFNPPIRPRNDTPLERDNTLPDGVLPIPRRRNRGNYEGRIRNRDSGTGVRGWLWPRRRGDQILPYDDTDDHWVPESGILARPRSWIILRPSGPLPTRRNLGEVIGLTTPRGNMDPRNYFIGPGLQELIEQLTQNDRPGPPPLPDSNIDAIPTVKLSSSHLVNESECPVCKEKFHIGDEARELPCNHIYHSDCIVPWLRLHNSCPVCRLELPVPSDHTGVAANDDSESSDGRGSRSQRCQRLRQQLASIWPFRSRYRHIHPQNDDGISSQGGADESWWRSCCIL